MGESRIHSDLPASPTEREQRLLREVAALAQRLLAAKPEDLDQEIQESLQQAAAVAGADRAYLAVFGRRTEPVATYEWIRPGLEDRRPDPSGDEELRFPWASARIRAGESIVCPDPAMLPDEAAAERERLLGRGVRSLLSLPIRPNQRVIGYQIFECLDEPRDWSPSEISLVRIMSEIFASSVIARRNEAALRTSEARIRAVAENAPHVIAEIDSHGRVLYVAPRVEELLGYRAQDLLGRSALEFFHPEDGPLAARMVDALRRGEESRIVARVRGAHGGWRWFEVAGQTFRTERGEDRAVVVASDVTVQRELEEALRDSQAQLFQSQKMEAVGRLAGGVAHDFNNLLMVIGGNLQQVTGEKRLSPEARTAARDALDAADRAASLTRRLLSFSRRGLMDPRPVDLNEVVQSMQTLLRRLLGEHIELRVRLTPGPSIVRGDRGQLEQVLVNLAVNARDAMGEGGELRIRTETRKLELDAARRLGLERAGAYHALVVEDDGVGIDPRAADHIFEPFYTTKEPGQGTGLGLSIVYSVAHQAGGTVQVRASQGAGATFEVLLPAVTASEAEAGEGVGEAPAARGGRLLLVEDEPAVRRLVTRMLEKEGYEVRVADDGTSALEQPLASIDLLITDVVMPRLGGPELARRLRLRFPDLSVLFLSGYPRDFQPGRLPADEAFLAKPFTREQLLRTVSELLGRSAD